MDTLKHPTYRMKSLDFFPSDFPFLEIRDYFEEIDFIDVMNLLIATIWKAKVPDFAKY
jgi:hypothetical protein